MMFLQRSKLIKPVGSISCADLSRLSVLQSSGHERAARCPRVHPFRTLSQVAAGSTAELGPTLSPAVRYLVGTHSITDLASIQASVPKNRLLKGDILKYLDDIKTGVAMTTQKETTSSAPTQMRKEPIRSSPPTHKPSYTDIPISEERREAARRSVESKQAIPHSYFSQDCNLPRELARKGSNFVQAHLIKSTALAIESMPDSNSVWVEGGVEDRAEVNILHHTLQDGEVSRKLFPAANRLRLRDIAQALEIGGDPEGNLVGDISIYQSFGSPVKQSTGILLPGETISLYISRYPSSSMEVTVTLTADSRVLDAELATKWLQLLQTIVSDSPLLG